MHHSFLVQKILSICDQEVWLRGFLYKLLYFGKVSVNPLLAHESFAELEDALRME